MRGVIEEMRETGREADREDPTCGKDERKTSGFMKKVRNNELDPSWKPGLPGRKDQEFGFTPEHPTAPLLWTRSLVARDTGSQWQENINLYKPVTG